MAYSQGLEEVLILMKHSFIAIYHYELLSPKFSLRGIEAGATCHKIWQVGVPLDAKWLKLDQPTA